MTSKNEKRQRSSLTRGLWLVTWCALLAPGARSEPSPDCDPGNPKLCAAPILRGEEAPFDGQVLTTELAVKLGQKADFCDRQSAVETSRVTQLLEVALEKERVVRKIDAEAHVEQIRTMQRNLDIALDKPFWTEPWFVATVSATVAVAATIGVGWLAIDLVRATQQNH